MWLSEFDKRFRMSCRASYTSRGSQDILFSFACDMYMRLPFSFVLDRDSPVRQSYSDQGHPLLTQYIQNGVIHSLVP